MGCNMDWGNDCNVGDNMDGGKGDNSAEDAPYDIFLEMRWLEITWNHRNYRNII